MLFFDCFALRHTRIAYLLGKMCMMVYVKVPHLYGDFGSTKKGKKTQTGKFLLKYFGGAINGWFNRSALFNKCLLTSLYFVERLHPAFQPVGIFFRTACVGNGQGQ
jgi:hypothetical protein